MLRPLERPRPIWIRGAALMAIAVASSGCGGSSGGGEAAAPTATSTTVPTNVQRPEGRWTFVRTTLTRDGQAHPDQGVSRVTLTQLTPTCGDGPCDLDVSPAGVDGTYRPDGVATSPTAVTPAAAPKPATYSWDAVARNYTAVDEVQKDSCTNADGKVIEDAYSTTTTVKMTHRPADGDRPATIIGTYSMKVTANEVGLADGCTPFDETGTLVGAPTGSLDGEADLDLAGSYVTTEIVTETEPSGQRPPGFRGLLGRFELTASGDGYAVEGLVGEAALAPTTTGFSGSTGEIERPCATTPETPAGFSSIEEFTDLTVVALTEEGAPILAGGWSLSEDPTPAGVDAGCSFSANAGYVILVPAASLA